MGHLPVLKSNAGRIPLKLDIIGVVFIFALQSFNLSTGEAYDILNAHLCIDVQVQIEISILAHCSGPAKQIKFQI